ncbi:DUF4365 domain-containing protein [Nocardia pneumoniae]|uniref:DUF4365 domain-containing protein n=1 Tax=Nocardia pneumoniae TaxID=228601 RepID=UPI0012F6CA34|nr:DUF4365 domain-containing protein [Nocardia pneumoniae]
MSVVPVIERTFTDCMEQLQEGYVAGVAATAGCTCQFLPRDQNGVDALITRQPDLLLEEVSILVQMKNTTLSKPDPSKVTFPYRFNTRRDMQMVAQLRGTPKKILIVMCTTPIQAEWTKATHQNLDMKHCCYWINLEGVAVPEVSKPSIKIPTRNVFDALALTKIMDKLEADGNLNGL